MKYCGKSVVASGLPGQLPPTAKFIKKWKYYTVDNQNKIEPWKVDVPDVLQKGTTKGSNGNDIVIAVITGKKVPISYRV